MRNLPGKERHRSGKEQGEGGTLAQCGAGHQPAGPGVRETMVGTLENQTSCSNFKKKPEL